jgi:predicted amidohydrolase
MSAFTIAAAQSSSAKGDIAENVRRHARLGAVAREHGADVVVFPELSLTGYEPTIAAQTAVELNDSVLKPLQEIAGSRQIVIMAGCPLRSACERPYIGMLIFRPGGAVAAYRKKFVHSSEEPYFVAGDETFVFTTGATTIGAAICADISHSIHAADTAARGARVYAAGVAKSPAEIERAEANMASHARTHGMLAVMANHASPTGGFPTAGHSAAWDETGTLVAQAQPDGECIVLATRTSDGWTGRLVLP